MKLFGTGPICALASSFVLAHAQDTCDEMGMLQVEGLKVDELGTLQESVEVLANVAPRMEPRTSFLTTHNELQALGALDVAHSQGAELGSQVMRVQLKEHRSRVVQRLSGHVSIDASQRHKTSYYGEISVGQQSFVVVFDTGSGNLILPVTECSDPACKQHERFDPSESSIVACDGSGEEQTDIIKIYFGTGEVSGQCYNDDICVGGICSRGDFIGATHESYQPFGQFDFDGVLGMSMLSLAQGRSFNLMSHMGRFLKSQIFSFYLSDSDLEPSQVVFGEVPEDLMVSNLLWAPVKRNSGYWEVMIDDVAVDNKPLGIASNYHVAVDSGTSALAGPSNVIKSMREALSVDPGCNNEHLPSLGFIVGDDEKWVLNLEPQDYLFEDGDSCDLAFMELDIPPPKGPLFILGVPFLRKFVTVYDGAASRVGFALAKHQESSSPSSIVPYKVGAHGQAH